MQTTMILSLIFLTSLLLLPYLGLQENHTLIEQKGVGFLPVLLPTVRPTSDPNKRPLPAVASSNRTCSGAHAPR